MGIGRSSIGQIRLALDETSTFEDVDDARDAAETEAHRARKIGQPDGATLCSCEAPHEADHAHVQCVLGLQLLVDIPLDLDEDLQETCPRVDRLTCPLVDRGAHQIGGASGDRFCSAAGQSGVSSSCLLEQVYTNNLL